MTQALQEAEWKPHCWPVAPPLEEGFPPSSFELLEPQPMATIVAIIKHALLIMMSSN
jgi:hypothetical protein